jgi:hypothetical protein
MKFKQFLAVLLLLATFSSLVYLNTPTSLEQMRRITVAYEQGQISLKTFRKIQRFLLDQQLR